MLVIGFTFLSASPFQSHGSLPVRIGAVIFGLGSIIYFALEFITVIEFSAECFSAVEAASVVAVMVLVVLQTYLIFVFPRMNLRTSPFIDRYYRTFITVFADSRSVEFKRIL